MVGLKMDLLWHYVTVLFISRVAIYSSQSLSKWHVLKCLVLFEQTGCTTLYFPLYSHFSHFPINKISSKLKTCLNEVNSLQGFHFSKQKSDFSVTIV